MGWSERASLLEQRRGWMKGHPVDTRKSYVASIQLHIWQLVGMKEWIGEWTECISIQDDVSEACLERIKLTGHLMLGVSKPTPRLHSFLGGSPLSPTQDWGLLSKRIQRKNQQRGHWLWASDWFPPVESDRTHLGDKWQQCMWNVIHQGSVWDAAPGVFLRCSSCRHSCLTPSIHLPEGK